MKPVLIVIASVLLLSGCAGSSNATACALYADSYNQMADITKLKIAGDAGVTTDMVKAETALVPARIQDAFDKATGDVAVKIRASHEAALIMRTSDDAGVAYFMTTGAVQAACAADGAAIDLHSMK
jgi:protein involved in sex pheromone biosynthesis